MNAASVIQKAEAYLNVQLTHAGPGGTGPMVGPFVTLSRESGTGGSLLAHALARRLADSGLGDTWQVYSGNVIEEMLRANNLSPALARFLPEDSIPQMDASVGELFGLHPDLWELVRKTNEMLRQLARSGHVILLGRGAKFATSGIAHGVHVRLVADPAHRASCTARWLSIDRATAATHNLQRDNARRRYVRANFDADITDPAAYDVVINVGRLERNYVIEAIAQLVRGRMQESTEVPKDLAAQRLVV